MVLNQESENENSISIEDIEFPLFIRSDEQEEAFARDGTIGSDEVRYYAELYKNYNFEIYFQTNFRRHTQGTDTITSSQLAYTEGQYSTTVELID
jgi:hypothetical protein